MSCVFDGGSYMNNLREGQLYIKITPVQNVCSISIFFLAKEIPLFHMPFPTIENDYAEWSNYEAMVTPSTAQGST